MYNSSGVATAPAGGVVAYTGSGSTTMALATAIALLAIGFVLSAVAKYRKQKEQ